MRKGVSTIWMLGAAALLAALLIGAGGASAADNAVITGDSVRVRTQPSVHEDVRGTLNTGTRVTVVSRTDFTDTIGGFTAPWYGIDYGEYGGYVFGRYVKLDPGAVVLPLPTSDIYGDRVSRFIARGLYRFGKGTPDVIASLGPPRSKVHEKATGLIIGVDTLTYEGLVIGAREVEGGKTFVYSVECTSAAYEFDTVKVGGTLWDIQRAIGPPVEPYTPGDETITYYNITGLDWVTFTMQGETVTGIAFYSGMAD